MSKYDLIAFDMDGTLLNSKKEIDSSTKDAIKRAIKAGKHVAISTGRCLPELKDVMPEIPDVRYVIAVNGAIVYDYFENKYISRVPVDDDSVEEMLEILKDEDVMIQMHSDKSYVQKDKQAHMDLYNMGVYQKFFDRVATKVDNLRETYLEERFPVYKFNVYPRYIEQREIFRNKFSHLPLTFAYAEIASLECSQTGISKASGLRALCEHLGTDISKAIAVGDSDNDLAMLNEAGLSIAMGNASVNAINAADVIVNDNDHGGCVQAIDDYLLT